MLETPNRIFEKSSKSSNNRLKTVLGGFLSVAILVGLVALGTIDNQENASQLSSDLVVNDSPPHINEVSPLAATIGDPLAITGTNFGATANDNQLKLGDYPMSIVSVGTTEGDEDTMTIVANVPVVEANGSFSVTLETENGSTVSPYKINIGSVASSAVNISSIDPSSGLPGDTVNIHGNNFDSKSNNNIVEFTHTNGKTIRATTKAVYQNGELILMTTVPYGADTGQVFVTTNGMTATSGFNFTVGSDVDNSSYPKITTISTTQVEPGQKITVIGPNLIDPSQGIQGTQLFFDEVLAEIQDFSINDNNDYILMVKVPTNANSGYLKVTVNGKTSFSAIPIEVSTRSPQIDTNRSVVSPAIVNAETATISLYTFVSDSEGVNDVMSVVANLSSIDGSPSKRMLEGSAEGNGRNFELLDYVLPSPLAQGQTYEIPIIATDFSGKTGSGTITIQTGLGETEFIPAETTHSSADNNIDVGSTGIFTPANLTALPDQNGIRLSWSGEVNQNHQVYYSTTSGSYLHRLPVGPTTSYLVSGLSTGQRYFFVVTAVDANGQESLPSNESSAIFPVQTQTSIQSVLPNIQSNFQPYISASIPSEVLETPKYLPFHTSAPEKLSEEGPAETVLFAGIGALILAGWVFRKKVFLLKSL